MEAAAKSSPSAKPLRSLTSPWEISQVISHVLHTKPHPSLLEILLRNRFWLSKSEVGMSLYTSNKLPVMAEMLACTLHYECKEWSQSVRRSGVSNSATPWAAALQAPLSKGFSRQEYWSGLPCPPPGDLPNLGIEPRSPALERFVTISLKVLRKSTLCWFSSVALSVILLFVNNQSLSREGNGNPLQYSCLENPVDGGAWWAAVHRVAQSQTRLKWLSMHACMGDGNGNPLQYSCLENPRDGGAWWAADYGVTRSGTWLKWLSSSSSLSPLVFIFF